MSSNEVIGLICCMPYYRDALYTFSHGRVMACLYELGSLKGNLTQQGNLTHLPRFSSDSSTADMPAYNAPLQSPLMPSYASRTHTLNC